MGPYDQAWLASVIGAKTRTKSTVSIRFSFQAGGFPCFDDNRRRDGEYVPDIHRTVR